MKMSTDPVDCWRSSHAEKATVTKSSLTSGSSRNAGLNGPTECSNQSSIDWRIKATSSPTGESPRQDGAESTTASSRRGRMSWNGCETTGRPSTLRSGEHGARSGQDDIQSAFPKPRGRSSSVASCADLDRRLLEFGASANRAAVFGLNLILLVRVTPVVRRS